MAKLALLFLLAAVVFSPSYQLDVGTCSCPDGCPDRPCCVYEDRPFQTSADSISDPEGTPLGFSNDILPGRDSDALHPCVAVNFPNPTSNNYISVVMQSIQQGSTACARQDTGETSACTQGLLGHYCDRANVVNGYAIVEFVCVSDGSCESDDIAFYYKIEIESLDTDDEFWCLNRDTSIPFSLIFGNGTINTVVPTLTDPTLPPSAAPALVSHSPLLLLLALLVGRILMA